MLLKHMTFDTEMPKDIRQLNCSTRNPCSRNTESASLQPARTHAPLNLDFSLKPKTDPGRNRSL